MDEAGPPGDGAQPPAWPQPLQSALDITAGPTGAGKITCARVRHGGRGRVFDAACIIRRGEEQCPAPGAPGRPPVSDGPVDGQDGRGCADIRPDGATVSGLDGITEGFINWRRTHLNGLAC